jgi:hypothetical protein
LREELSSLALALRSEEGLRRSRFKKLGTPVRVVAGPMTGLCGELVRVKGTCRLIVRVSFIGKGAELEIDEALVEPI